MLKNILFFLLPFILFSQEDKIKNTLIVDYSHSVKLEGIPSAVVVNSKLTSTFDISLYEMDFSNNSNFESEESTESGTVFHVKSGNNEFIFKDFKDQSIYSLEYVLIQPFVVKDTMSVFKWNIENSFKTILGYKCQKVSLNYRGRSYVAFFTMELPFKTGPWKFCGLPGAILEVYSIDNAVSIKANKIQVKSGEVNIENQYVKRYSKEIVSWNTFVDEYRKKYNELLHYRTPGGGTMQIPKKGIETYIE